MKLTVARDVYGRHYEELDEEQRRHLMELIALRRIEGEETEERMRERD